MTNPTYDPNNRVNIGAEISRPIEQVWSEFTNPESITQWNTAHPDWHTPRAEHDLQNGGRFNYRMEAKDGSMGFDFGGTYDDVQEGKRIAYTMDDGRQSQVDFEATETGTRMTQWFDPEGMNPPEMQQQGWQNILDSFKAWVETR